MGGLWEVRAARCAPRFLGGKSSVSSSVVTLGTGKDAFVSGSSTGAGVQNLSLREWFGRVPSVVPVNDKSVLTGNAGAYANGESTASVLKIANRNAGSAADGSAFFLVAGNASGDVNCLDPRANLVKSGWNDSFLLVGRIASTGVVSAGKYRFTCAKTSTGVYSIGLQNVTVGSPIVAVATAISATKTEMHISNCTTSGCTVTSTQNGSAADVDFFIWVYASKKLDPLYSKWGPLLCNVRKAQLTVVKYNSTTEVLVEGSGEVTATKTGTGLVTFAWTEKYKPIKSPSIISAAGFLGTTQVSDASTTGFSLDSFNGTGVATDGLVTAFVLSGFNTDDEF